MKIYRIGGIMCAALLLFSAGLALAADQPAPSKDAPAILASLDAGSATLLDDQTINAIRGQGFEYKYVLVKILGINALDWGPGVQWTGNPLGYRYGYWGGPGWTNGGSNDFNSLATYADGEDGMDALFKTHDLAYMNNQDKLLADKALLAGLFNLHKTTNGYWGPIYIANPIGLNSPLVFVSGASFIGGRIFFGWRPMPYTEYARREALAGMGVTILGRSLASSIRLQ